MTIPRRLRPRNLAIIALLGVTCSVAPLGNVAQAATGSSYCGSGTSYHGSTSKGPAYKLQFTGVTYPGNPSLGIGHYKEYKVWANGYYQWVYIGKETHACG